MMMEQGATSVRAVCTHAVLSGEACDAHPEAARSPSSSLPTPFPSAAEKLQRTTKIKQLTVAQLFADVIQRVRSHESISSHFIIA